jgi:hypothetical protein
MLRIAVRYIRPLLIAWALAGCSTTSGTTPGGGSSSGAGSSGGSDDSGSQSSSDDSGSSTGTHDSGGSGDGAAGLGGDSGPLQDGGSPHDGGTVDGSHGDGGTGDAAVGNIGSCCSTQTTPGCDNADLELCVCNKIPTCCTTAWNAPCVTLVQQKYCQLGVRDCVCGTDAGQWAQTSCCTSDWTTNPVCDSVATNKCGATQGCF